MEESITEQTIDRKELLRESLMPASMGKRFLNFIIDLVVFYVFAIAIGVILGLLIAFFGVDEDILEISNGVDIVFSLMARMIYYIIFEHFFGRTIGKMITRTRVVTDDGEKPTFGQILGRTFARLIPFEGFSFLREQPVGWHDSMSGTMVINDSDLYNYLAEEKDNNPLV